MAEPVDGKSRTQVLSDPVEGSLLGRVVRGGAWTGAGSVLTVLLPMLRNLILIKGFLDPDDFGLWMIIWVVVSAANVFSATSMGTAIIQKPEGTRNEYLQTAWLIEALRGLVLAVLTFAAATLVGGYYRRPELVGPFRCMAVVFLLSGLASPRVLLLTKQMKFKRLVMLEQISMAASVTVAIVLGVLWRDVWALVVAELVRVTVLVALGYVVAPFKPGFTISVRAAKDLWAYGKHIYASNICLFLLLQGDCLVVGRMLSAQGARLGNYWQGRQMAQLPAMMVAGLVSRVSFPAYAKMQDNRERTANAYLRVMMFTACYAWPAVLGLACLAPVLPQYAGPKWDSLVLPMQILCVATLVKTLNSTAGALFMGIGRPELLTRLAAVNLLLLAVLLFPLVAAYGIVGAAWAVSISQVLIWPIVFWLVRRTLQMRWSRLLSAMFAPLPAALVMTVLVLLLRLVGLHWLIYSALAVSCGAACYVGVLWLTAREHVKELKRAAREGLRR